MPTRPTRLSWGLAARIRTSRSATSPPPAGCGCSRTPSPAGPNAPPATRCRPSTSSASTRCSSTRTTTTAAWSPTSCGRSSTWACSPSRCPPPPEELPRLVNQEDETQPLDRRARSYLHSNCAHCHMKWGGGNAEFQLLATLPLNELGIVGTPAAHGAFELTDARVLSPGHPERSLIPYRMNKLGLGRM